VAIGVLEFSTAWRGNWPMQASAWLVTGGAMAWSALAINSVVHRGWAFGLIADAAALSAMYFLLNGPTAAQAVAKAAAREVELLEQAEAERSARLEAEADHERSAGEMQARFRAEIARVTAAGEAALGNLRAEMTQGLEETRAALGTAESSLADARSQVEADAVRIDTLTRKLERATGRSAGGSGRSGTAPRATTRTAGGAAPDDDLELEAKALKLLATDLDMSGAELARQLNVSDSYGRKLRRRLTGDRPAEGEQDRPEDRTGTAPADRGEDR
jgi:hypothetical protein